MGRKRRAPSAAEPVPAIECSPEEIQVLQRLAASRTAGVWRVKRAKIVLGALAGERPERLMWEVRVPVKTVAAFLCSFARLRLAALDRPTRRPTAREMAVERMLAFLERPPPEGSPAWDALKVHYIGREYTARDIASVRDLIGVRPGAPVSVLALELCAAFGLYQVNGNPRKTVAGQVLRRMGMDNIVALPSPAREKGNARRSHRGPLPAADPEPVVEAHTRRLFFLPVGGAGASALWRGTLERHHYIGSQRLFGAQVRYFVYGCSGAAPAEGAWGAGDSAPGPLLACLGFAAAALRVTARDDFIGWNDEQRLRNLRLVAGNARFLILPWVRVKCLASRILGAAARHLPADWEARYGYRPVLLETFVQLDRFSGTCYRAANWVQVGETRGYSAHGKEARMSAPPRAVLLYPLRRDFRKVLCSDSPGARG